jgi:hypothetical protein
MAAESSTSSTILQSFLATSGRHSSTHLRLAKFSTMPKKISVPGNQI